MVNEINSNIGFDLTALDVLLDSIASDANQLDINRDTYYGSLHRKLIASTKSAASLIWVAHQGLSSAHSEGPVQLPR